MSVLYAISLTLSAFCLIIYYLSKWKFDYWEKKRVPYAKPLPIVGNYGEYILMKKPSGTVIQELCHQFPDEPYFGTFFGTEPALVVKDPELLKLIFTKDYYYFSGRETSKYTRHEVITQNMFFDYGDNWKVTRQNLTPLFSSAKMKNMFYMIENCTKALEDMMDYETAGSEIIETRSLIVKYTMDSICSCAFGVEANTMGKDQNNNPFWLMADQIFSPTTISGFKVAMRLIWPGIFYSLKMKWFPTTLGDFFYHMMTRVFNQRDYKPSQRNDFVDSVLTFKKDSYIEGDSLSNSITGGSKKVQLKVDDAMLVSQCVMFFAAGFETSSTTIAFTLYEMAKNQDIQKRASAEISEYLERKKGKLDYSCVSELPYLDACVMEATRLYPLFGILAREVMDDYIFPTGLRVKKGLRIHVPTNYIHRDPNYYPEPMKYKPERFLPGAKDEIKPYTFLSFGEGPRTCIGMRFAKMQGLAALVTILKNYRIELAEGMPKNVELDPRIYLAKPNCDINLKFIKREYK